MPHTTYSDFSTETSTSWESLKSSQWERFDRLAPRFRDAWSAVDQDADPTLVRDDWEERNQAVAQEFSAGPPRNFLHHPAIRYQMFVNQRYLSHELPFVLAQNPPPAVLEEDVVGSPDLVTAESLKVVTSSNTVHHLHHLYRYQNAVGAELSQLGTVVEWGGGYGNLAKLIRRLSTEAPTYVVIDTPVFAALQWLYLSSVLGEEAVVLHRQRGQTVVSGAVNVVPCGWAFDLDVGADLFISTWALNESTPAAQEKVIASQWFGAQSLLLGMHGGDPLERSVLAAGAHAEPIGEFMENQYYFFR